jgi:hypothetical protein
MAPGDAKEHASAENITKAAPDLLQMIHQLKMQALDADSKISQPAFETLTQTLHAVFAWLHMLALLHPISLGALLRRLPEDDAWARYEAGEHSAAWAGVELARLYRQIQAELKSRSKRSLNRLRDIRYGFKLREFVVPPNSWFCAEYERKADYRPTGKMAVWAAWKIEELRQIKSKRSEWRQQFARIEIVEGHPRLRDENEIDDVLADWFRSDIVEGEALKRLDNLSAFGSPNAEDFDKWRRFVRRRLLTPKLITEFDALFPNSRRKLDGVVAATLRSAWRAVRHGGNVTLL